MAESTLILITVPLDVTGTFTLKTVDSSGLYSML